MGFIVNFSSKLKPHTILRDVNSLAPREFPIILSYKSYLTYTSNQSQPDFRVNAKISLTQTTHTVFWSWRDTA